MNGIIYIDKPKGCTSRDVVNDVSKKLQIKKMGHTGTLDPMATGVLILCAGKATKVVDEITSYSKEYIAEATLGVKTDTGDITGSVISIKIKDVNEEEIKAALNSMIGKYEQTVPIYSAVKINGKKLYEYAREGLEVVLPKREVEIKTLSLVSSITKKSDLIKFQIQTEVSKGTYIRALIEDIAEKLGTVGTMSELRRTRQGNVKVDECLKIEEVDNTSLKNISEVLDIYKVEVDNLVKEDISHGKKIINIYEKNKILFTDIEGNALAIYEVDLKNNELIKPTKVFI